MSNPNPPATPTKSPRWFWWVAIGALVAFGALLASKATAVAGGSDSSGYLNSARLLGALRLQTELRLPPEIGAATEVKREHFTPLGFLPARSPGYVAPTYPTGLPLHFALAARFLGWRLGPSLIIVGGALVAVWLCYLVARELGLSVALSAAGATMLAASPLFLFSSIQALSDTLATTWCLAATWFALRARRNANWAAATGLAFSIAVLVRPTNVLFAPALLILLGLDFGRLARFAVAGLPAAAWFLFYNNHQYGGPLKSGYGDVASAFALVYGVPTFVHFAKWLAAFFPSVVLVLPFFALTQPATRTRAFAALAVAFVTITGFYLFYDVSHDVWWCLRFILPVVPALIILALLGVEALARGPVARWPRTFRPAVAVLLGAWSVAGAFYWVRSLHVFLIERYERAYETASLAAKAQLPKDALVATSAFSGAMYFYTDFAVLRSDVVEAPDFARYASRARTAGRPVCAVVFDFEEQELRTRCPGNWSKLNSVGNVGLWQLE